MKNIATAVRLLALAAIIIVASTSVTAQQHSHQALKSCSKPCTMMQSGDKAEAAHQQHASRSDRADGHNHRGDRAMGFSQEKSTHHFRLLKDGGAIEVNANDPADAATRDRIRRHLAHIAGAFSNGDFSIPNAVHAQDPSGVPALRRMKEAIKYQFEETERGGRVRILTASPEALAAVHEFLRFQIKEHQTGDPLEVDHR